MIADNHELEGDAQSPGHLVAGQFQRAAGKAIEAGQPQPVLPLDVEPTPTGRVADPAEVAAMEEALEDGALTRRELQAIFPAWDERHIRLLASSSRVIVSFPGSAGYTLVKHCKSAELYQAAAAIAAQIQAMQRKRIHLQNLAGLAAAMELRTCPAPAGTEDRDLAQYLADRRGNREEQ